MKVTSAQIALFAQPLDIKGKKPQRSAHSRTHRNAQGSKRKDCHIENPNLWIPNMAALYLGCPIVLTYPERKYNA